MEEVSDTPNPDSRNFHQEQVLNTSDHSTFKSILSASLIYVILSYLNTYGNIVMYIASYLRVSTNNPEINVNYISPIFSLAILLQSLSSLLTSRVEKSLGSRKSTIIGCTITAFSYIACGLNLRSLTSLVFFYSVVGGIASGLILPIPLDDVVRKNPTRKGFVCGSVYFYSGLFTIFMCPLQTFYINKGDIRLGDVVRPSDNDAYYKDIKLLNRIPKLFILQGLFYLALLALCYYFLDFPKDRKPSTSFVEPEIEYETFVNKRSVNSNDSSTSQSHDYKKYFNLWFLIYLSWQSIIYLQSYWKAIALVKFDASDLFITLIGAIASCFNMVGRILWGIVFDLIGWEASWQILVISTLAITVTSNILFEHNLIVYGLWVIGVFFIHSGVFSVGPMTAHHFFGQNKFIMSVGFLNTARAASGLTALIYSRLKYSRSDNHLPITVSLICLSSLLIIRLFNSGKKKSSSQLPT